MVVEQLTSLRNHIDCVRADHGRCSVSGFQKFTSDLHGQKMFGFWKLLKLMRFFKTLYDLDPGMKIDQ